MTADAGFLQVGILVNDIEFIPLDIMRRHMPLAQPPDVKIEAVYVRQGGDDDGS